MDGYPSCPPRLAKYAFYVAFDVVRRQVTVSHRRLDALVSEQFLHPIKVHPGDHEAYVWRRL